MPRIFESDEHALTSKVYSQARISRVGKSDTYKRPWGDGEVVVEMIGGSSYTRALGDRRGRC